MSIERGTAALLDLAHDASYSRHEVQSFLDRALRDVGWKKEEAVKTEAGTFEHRFPNREGD